MKELIKKWYFWVIIIVVIIIICVVISKYVKNQRIEKTFENMGKSASDFISGIDNAKSHIDEFNYNSVTGEVEYKPKEITLEMYDRIKKEMTIEEVILTLGNYDNKLEGENTYLIEWGESNMSKGYWISIVFNKDGTVFSKSQLGLK